MNPNEADPPRWWSVDQARRWIVHRDPNRPLALEADRRPTRPDPSSETEGEREAERQRIAPMLAEMRAAAEALKRAIADGHLAARGIREPGADPEPIPPATMANPAVRFSLAGNFIGPDSTVPGWERVPLPLFRHVQVERAGMVALWHPRPPGAEEAAAWLRENMASAHYKVAIAAVRKALNVSEAVARAGWSLAGLTRGPGRRRRAER